MALPNDENDQVLRTKLREQLKKGVKGIKENKSFTSSQIQALNAGDYDTRRQIVPQSPNSIRRAFIDGHYVQKKTSEESVSSLMPKH